MFEIEVNNRTIEACEGETIISALNRAGIKVPTLCHIDGLKPTGSCRVCSVEVEGFDNLIPSCSYPVREGMKIKTNSRKARIARKTIIELLLANHPDDCLYCVRSGECELQTLAEDYGVRERRYAGEKTKHKMDISSASIIRDQDKCILCGKCVRACDEIQDVQAIELVGRGSQTVVAPAFEECLNVSSCVNCGQCVMVCPTGALREKSALKDVLSAINDPEKVVVIQHAPSVSISLAESFGLPAGTDMNSLMVSAFRYIGFDYVFDTSFSADLTIMEEAAELVERITNGGKLPMMTSCSPGWIKFVEQFYHEFIDNLSTCKSPQQMMGAVIKSYFAEKNGIKPENIYSVSVMPCTAKKFEAQRPEMGEDGIQDVDAVLTIRETARLLKLHGIDFNGMEPDHADTPFGTRSSAGKLFGGSGGVMEAAIRTAHFMLTGENMQKLRVKEVRGEGDIKTKIIHVAGLELGVAVVNGIGNARKLLEEIKAGREDIHFIEVMTCPGGCVGGGGQSMSLDLEKLKCRQKALYKIDQTANLRTCHENPEIQRLYDEYLGKPLGHKSHELLHTHYTKRDVLV